ncbi:hypothetical protein ACLI1A_13335 [Flavobacterium sp. RHBU_3]|uniref:hypothetical protein n=1 Tax=Flavobacterium sp. RHBU_3 TaxID=3391184 RepID=UPI003984647D
MKNLTIQQYARLPDTTLYDGILEALNPANTFAGKKMDIQQMPYANVKYCIRLLGKTSSWPDVVKLFTTCYGCTEKQFWKVRVVEYFGARRFLINEFTRIIQTETRLLHTLSTDSHLWHMAGADRLKPFGDTLPLVQLGKMFGQYPYDLGRKPYGEIFSLLAQIKTQNEVEAEYSKLAK